MSRLSNTGEQISEVFGRLTSRQKIGMIVATIVTVGGLLWIVLAATEEPMRVLMSDVTPEQMAKLGEELDGKQIPYEVSGETTIMVPQDRLHEARMHLAGEGMLAADGAGFELFDDADFGMTAFTQKVNYQRAMESELSRTIKSLDSVKAARVHLVMPEDALFREDQKEPTASVVVTTANGMSPTPGQIQSMRYLVASAVEGLEPNLVTILDSNGNLLAQGANSDVADSGSFVTMARRMEGDLERRVDELLATIVGPASARTRVSVDLDTAEVIETVESYDPEQVAVRSEQRSEQTVTRADRAAAGAPGTATNLPGGPAAETDAGGSEDVRSSETVNYDVSKTVRQTTQLTPELDRLTVAVVVDETALAAAAGVEEGETYDRAGMVARLTNLVQNAVGYDETRGDQVLVTVERFAPVAATEEAEPSFWTSPEFLMPATRYGLLLVIALLIGIFVARPLFKALLAAPDKALDAELDPEGATAQSARLEGSTESHAALGSERSPEEELREEIVALGRSDVDKTSKVISQWIRIGTQG